MFNKNEGKQSSPFFSPPLQTLEEEAGKLATLFSSELWDVSCRYQNERFFSGHYHYHANGLRSMLRVISGKDNLGAINRLCLLIKLTLDLDHYLTINESKQFKSLLDSFMHNHNVLIKDKAAPTLLAIIKKIPYCCNFYLYFLGGGNMLYNPRKYFAGLYGHYEAFITHNPYYEYNNRQYTLEQLVEEFITEHKNAAYHQAKIGKMPLNPRPRDELDVPESVIDMHNLL